MVFVFDLDDTLYDELTFVKSGFSAVADFLSKKYSIDSNAIIKKMDAVMNAKGRGHVFDDTLKHFNIFSKLEVKKCLSIYRLHNPKIELWPEAISCLNRLKNYPIYIVTDGNKNTQYRKIKALGLDKIVKKYYITYRHGLINSKPSPYCLLKIAELEREKPENIIYIGDNISKDFVGIKPLGFKTIRVKTGQHASMIKSSEFHADNTIENLSELTIEYLNKIYGI